MKHILFTVLLLQFIPATLVAAIIKNGTLESKTNNRSFPYVVVLPEKYDSLVKSGKRFPVLYILHCAGCDHTTPLTSGGGEFHNFVDSVDFIIAVPHDGSVSDAKPFSWWLDSPLLPDQQLSSFLVKEFKPHIDSLYATLPQPGNTGLCGHSMGGFGSLHNLIRHSDVFSCAFSIKGGFDVSNPPNSNWPSYFGLNTLLGTDTLHAPNWDSVNVLRTISKLSGKQKKVAFYAGKNDTWFYNEAIQLHKLMDSLKIAHTFYATSEDHFGVPDEQAKTIIHFFDTAFTYSSDAQSVLSGYIRINQLDRINTGLFFYDILGRDVSIKNIIARRRPGIYLTKATSENRGQSGLIVVMP